MRASTIEISLALQSNVEVNSKFVGDLLCDVHAWLRRRQSNGVWSTHQKKSSTNDEDSDLISKSAYTERVLRYSWLMPAYVANLLQYRNSWIWYSQVAGAKLKKKKNERKILFGGERERCEANKRCMGRAWAHPSPRTHFHVVNLYL